jgi:UTP--glucose-1-phosphate uridylyltransferase
MNKIVKKAIIPAAGLGTRFLPATKSLPKEMLPILNIPTIQYIVEEAKNAGIEDICIIVSSSKNAIIDHFDSNFELESRLKNKNKMDFYEIVRNIGEGINIYFIRQKEPKGLGHAILQAKTFIGNEPFAVILGDDFVRPEKNKINAIGQCIEAFDKTRNNILGVQKVEKNNIKKYGIVAPKDINPN